GLAQDVPADPPAAGVTGDPGWRAHVVSGSTDRVRHARVPADSGATAGHDNPDLSVLPVPQSAEPGGRVCHSVVAGRGRRAALAGTPSRSSALHDGRWARCVARAISARCLAMAALCGVPGPAAPVVGAAVRGASGDLTFEGLGQWARARESH